VVSERCEWALISSPLSMRQRTVRIVQLLFKGDQATVGLMALGTPTLLVLSFKLAHVGNEPSLELWVPVWARI